VATGAELKCISGFTTSNYLEQPYNSDLNFGTGDFSISCWVKKSAGTSYRRFLNYQSSTGSQTDDNAITFKFAPDGGLGQIYAYLGSVDTSINTANNLPTDTWISVVLVRSASTYYLYRNGELDATKTATSAKGSATHILRIGYGVENSEPFTGGSIALPRISATAPTASQIKEIYEAEKPMFQENAKCTLDGTSDSVTAMSYDDSNDELLVGTSTNLSVFKGLRRVDENTNNITEVAQQGGLRVEEY
jgi:hypothetical protein